jgi:hypothetical protein
LQIVDDDDDNNNNHHHHHLHGGSVVNDRVFGKRCVVFTDKAHLRECYSLYELLCVMVAICINM